MTSGSSAIDELLRDEQCYRIPPRGRCVHAQMAAALPLHASSQARRRAFSNTNGVIPLFFPSFLRMKGPFRTRTVQVLLRPRTQVHKRGSCAKQAYPGNLYKLRTNIFSEVCALLRPSCSIASRLRRPCKLLR